MLECGKYRWERQIQKSELQKNTVQLRVTKIFQMSAGHGVYRAISVFLRATAVYMKTKV